MEENKELEKPPVSKAKRIWAWIGIVAILTVYIVGLVFAFMGKGYTVTVVMTCILLASYIAVYFHLGQVLIGLIKGNNKKHSDKGDKENE